MFIRLFEYSGKAWAEKPRTWIRIKAFIGLKANCIVGQTSLPALKLLMGEAAIDKTNALGSFIPVTHLYNVCLQLGPLKER